MYASKRSLNHHIFEDIDTSARGNQQYAVKISKTLETLFSTSVSINDKTFVVWPANNKSMRHVLTIGDCLCESGIKNRSYPILWAVSEACQSMKSCNACRVEPPPWRWYREGGGLPLCCSAQCGPRDVPPHASHTDPSRTNVLDAAYTNDDDCIVHEWWWSHRTQKMIVIMMMIA